MITALGPDGVSCMDMTRKHHQFIVSHFVEQRIPKGQYRPIVYMRDPARGGEMTLPAFAKYCAENVKDFAHWDAGTIQHAVRALLRHSDVNLIPGVKHIKTFENGRLIQEVVEEL